MGAMTRRSLYHYILAHPSPSTPKRRWFCSTGRSRDGRHLAATNFRRVT